MTLVAFVGQGWPAERGDSTPSGRASEPVPRQRPAPITRQIAAPTTTQTAVPPANPAVRRVEPSVVTLNFINADIEGVVKVMTEITGKNFVVDPRVKGTITIVSAKPMQRALVYDVFLSALRLQGFTAVEDRGIVNVLP